MPTRTGSNHNRGSNILLNIATNTLYIIRYTSNLFARLLTSIGRPLTHFIVNLLRFYNRLLHQTISHPPALFTPPTPTLPPLSHYFSQLSNHSHHFIKKYQTITAKITRFVSTLARIPHTAHSLRTHLVNHSPSFSKPLPHPTFSTPHLQIKQLAISTISTLHSLLTSLLSNTSIYIKTRQQRFSDLTKLIRSHTLHTASTIISHFHTSRSLALHTIHSTSKHFNSTANSLVHTLHSFFHQTTHFFHQSQTKLLLHLSSLHLHTRTYLQHLHSSLTHHLSRLHFPHISPPPLLTSLHHSLTKPRSPKPCYLIVLLVITTISILSLTFYHQILKDLPDPTLLATQKPILSTKIYDRNGHLLYKLYQNQNRTLVSLSQIPLHLQQATIAIEDQDFYNHSGISLKGIIRAAKVNLTGNGFQGGSTITQQLIKNTLLTSERTVSRKIKEALIAIVTEFYFTKDEILTMYFNQVPYGGTAYGIEEASQMYFGKTVSDLNLAESAFLAGLPAAPTKYSPYGTNPELASSRQHQVLFRLVEDGYITQGQAQQAFTTPLSITPHQNPIEAPHFVMYVKDLLVQQYGLHSVEQGGLEIITSLDLNLQHQVEQLALQEVSQLQALNVTNGAAIVTHPPTGEILAMVGSINYFDTQNDGQVNVTLRPRQPGSSIKPVNYAMALENGLTPATIIPDSPICYQIPGQPPYCPKNYDNRFHGLVTLRKALANSYNVPAVKTLNQFGVDRMITYGQKLGLTTWNQKNRFGLALTLGGGEVRMIDMAEVYGTFANAGIHTSVNPILLVKNADGKILEENCTNPHLSTTPLITTSPRSCPQSRVLDPRVAYQITDILSDNQARSAAFGSNSVLYIPHHQIAVKTGTTNNLRDNWTLGYTKDFLVATWVGNNDNTPMSYIASGITGASPMWNHIISLFLDRQHPHQFTPPPNLNKVAVCTLTGTLSCNGCPTREEYFIPGTEPTTHCNQDQIARILHPETSNN